ncbi:hypothetical protein O0S10_09420 [Methanocorpusculum sp. MG]|uniref:DUF4352 domain-containing protein n=1 Tax=Methanocorpusculum petauri TaxID=3002863 RepID=A0ABT4II64_9EURY|nr:hypothetical protein [Methanocorpusculum petauri]MCZ0861433.1 hypothetical protein [Methanocorpusculum petauri]MDE2444120.1 hypothetical protein [Methanocorpusculum sp.]
MKKHLLPLLLIIAVTAVLLSAGCIDPEQSAAPTPTPLQTTAVPTATIIPDNDIVLLDVLTVYRGADAMQELSTSGFSTTYLKEGTTTYLIEVTLTCKTLGKHSRREGYMGSVTVSDADLQLYLPNSSSSRSYFAATQLQPVPEKYHNKMLYNDVVLKEGESVTGWVLYTGVPEGDATLTLQKKGCETVSVPI